MDPFVAGTSSGLCITMVLASSHAPPFESEELQTVSTAVILE
jgi:hypothetical protein